MKKIVLLTGILVFALITSCEKNIYPFASFTASYSLVQPYEIINFSNRSTDATSYIWDFGDGTTSQNSSPTHHYENEGLYTVTLTATSIDGFTSQAQVTIEVLYTLLEITVVEWNTDEIVEFIVPDALVILYNSLVDWEEDKNEVASGYTNAQGEITFEGVEERSYWVWSESNDFPNVGDRYDNEDFYSQNLDSYLNTPVMVPFALNKWISWVDYFPANKSAKESRRSKYPKGKKKTKVPFYRTPVEK